MNCIKYLLAFFLTCSLCCCEDIIVKSENDENNLADFEKAWQGINAVYPYFEIKNIDWDQIYQKYRPTAEAAKGDEIYTVLVDLLAELKDQHPYIEFLGGRQVNVYLSPRYIRDKELYNPVVVKKYFDKEFFIAGGGFIEYQVLPDNIGYINISSFTPPQLTNDFQTILNYFANTKGVIIDVRHNMGGSADNSNRFLAYLISSDFPVPEAYSNHQLIPQEPIKPNGYKFSKPIVVLINGVSYSEAERFTVMMTQLENVTSVGDTTGGGSAGSNGVRDEILLPSGRIVHVGTIDFRRYDGKPWEWIGIEPDIRITNSKENLRKSIDNQLEYAIGLLKLADR